MTPRVNWTSLATASPMGQQHYEVKIQEAMRIAGGSGWQFITSTVASLRSPVPANARFPMQLVHRMPASLAALAGQIRYPRADLVHRFDLRVPPGRLPEVVTAHDLPPARFDDEGGLPRFAMASARRAVGVICPSTFAADELRSLCGVTQTWVIPYGLSAEFQDPKPLPSLDLEALGVRGRYVVHAAGATKRKNLAGLAAAWQTLQSEGVDATLVLCGPPDQRRDDAFDGLAAVVKTGRLSLDTVAQLMAGAAAVVVPSTYEGFGLPALEGMACGAPVVAARCGALPEVCGDAGLLVAPSGEGLAAGLTLVLSDSDVAGRLVAQGLRRAKDFDWAVAADAHLDVYRQVLGI
jgi:glycosyltransferase involved in cell wall biosynthesis